MNLILRRKKNNGDTTIGHLTDDSLFYSAHTLEDEPRAVKVKGETRIPSGTFEIKERKDAVDKDGNPVGMTKRYREKFPWFKWHLQLQDVPGFNYIYVHPGNTDEHTDGCILVGYQTGDWKIWESTEAFRDFYFYVMGALNAGQRVFISIKDEDGNG